MAERIVVLDGYTLNPGDIDWSPIAALGEIEVHDRTPPEQVAARVGGATCLLTNKTPLTSDVLEKLPSLRYIGVLATGFDCVDVDAATRQGLVVTNIPTYGTDSVAQHVMAMVLELARGVAVHDRAVRAGEWSRNADWCFARQPIFELTGKTLGIVGLGRIGLAVARIAAAMDMSLVAYDLHWPDADRLEGLAVERVSLDELFARADVVSLHCPLTADSRHLVNAERLRAMKPTALLINTSRGPLVDEHALAQALHDNVITGAALDVLETEPPAGDNPLFSAPNCLITPHVAWYAVEARRRLMQIAADNLAAFLAGTPRNVVE